MKVRLSTMLWLTMVICLLLGWYVDHYSLRRQVERAETKLKFLQSFDGQETTQRGIR